VEGSVYWQASAPFETTRVQVAEIDSGRYYLIDLQAREGGSTAPVQILRKDSPVGPATGPAEVATDATHQDRHANLDYVTLTRYAAQQMYAPSRLRPSFPGVFRIPLTTAKVNLVRGGAVEATPLIAWQGGGLFVTVVRLRNRTAYPVVLDPRDLRGAWLTATFQHARLFPQGDEADVTCVYLISARPFEDSLRGLL
jgi:integrating conjugative element protein (TIGR03749 family)